MSGICSAHVAHEPGCRLCDMTPVDIFGERTWNDVMTEAEPSGLVTCKGWRKFYDERDDSHWQQACNFEFYLTADSCPLCGTKYEKEVPCATT